MRKFQSRKSLWVKKFRVKSSVGEKSWRVKSLCVKKLFDDEEFTDENSVVAKKFVSEKVQVGESF